MLPCTCVYWPWCDLDLLFLQPNYAWCHHSATGLCWLIVKWRDNGLISLTTKPNCLLLRDRHTTCRVRTIPRELPNTQYALTYELRKCSLMLFNIKMVLQNFNKVILKLTELMLSCAQSALGGLAIIISYNNLRFIYLLAILESR